MNVKIKENNLNKHSELLNRSILSGLLLVLFGIATYSMANERLGLQNATGNSYQITSTLNATSSNILPSDRLTGINVLACDERVSILTRFNSDGDLEVCKPTGLSDVNGNTIWEWQSHQIVDKNIADLAVGQRHVQVNAVGGNQVRSRSLEGDRLMLNAISNIEIADGAVRNQHIQNSAIDNSKIALRSLSGNNLQTGAITNNELGVGAVDTKHFANGAVTGTKIASNSISTNKFAPNAVTQAKTSGLLNAGQARSIIRSHFDAIAAEMLRED